MSARNLPASQAVSVCPPCPVLGASKHMQSSQVESQLPTAYLLALPAFQPAKWTHLPGVGPTPPGLVWPICGLNCLLPWEDLSPCNPPPLLSPLPGAQADFDGFSSLPTQVHVDLFLQPRLNKSFCQFPVFNENCSTCRCICGGR